MYSNWIQLNINLIKFEFVSDISKLNWNSKNVFQIQLKIKILCAKSNWIESNLEFSNLKKIMNQQIYISKKLLNQILDFELKFQTEILI